MKSGSNSAPHIERVVDMALLSKASHVTSHDDSKSVPQKTERKACKGLTLIGGLCCPAQTTQGLMSKA